MDVHPTRPARCPVARLQVEAEEFAAVLRSIGEYGREARPLTAISPGLARGGLQGMFGDRGLQEGWSSSESGEEEG